jgi:hypothetical protein
MRGVYIEHSGSDGKERSEQNLRSRAAVNKRAERLGRLRREMIRTFHQRGC